MAGLAAITSTSTTTPLSLKLLVNTATNKVIFADANKDFVDFLFHILSLPVGTIIRLLTTKCMTGSLGNLYESLQNLNLEYVQPSFNKDYLLNPTSSSPTCLSAPLLWSNIEGLEEEGKRLYRCRASRSYCSLGYVSKYPNVICPQCGCYRMSSEVQYVVSASNNEEEEKQLYRCPSRSSFCKNRYVSKDPTVMCPECDAYRMSEEVRYVASASNKKINAIDCREDGYVKGVVSYMVMDDLVVQPMSTTSSIALLSKFGIKDVSVLEEKLVSFGFDQGLSLLKASLQSQTVLTDVFLGEPAKDRPYRIEFRLDP